MADQLPITPVYTETYETETKILIDDIVIDVLSSTSQGRAYNITQRPVEDGSLVSDNRYKLPTSVTMSCIIVDDENVGGKTWQAKRDELLDLSDVDQVVTITLPNQTLPSMMISSLNDTTTAATATAYFFTIRFQHVNFIRNQFVLVDKRSIPQRIVQSKSDIQNDAELQKAQKEEKARILSTEATDAATNQRWVDNINGVLPL